MHIVIRRVLTRPNSPSPLFAATKTTRIADANSGSGGMAKREGDALAAFNAHNREFYGKKGAPR